MKYLLLFIGLTVGLQTFSQGIKKSPFNGYLPIRESPELNWSTPMTKSEPLLFEAEPILYYNLYNNYPYYESKENPKAEAFYLYFNSHFRMFQGRSRPVRMPSYKIFMGWQRSYDLGRDYFSFAIESGHYSNGQSGCAWSDTAVDGTRSCELIAESLADEEDLSKRLNRINGNFSTNLSKIRFQYVLPKRGLGNMNIHRFDLDYTYKHVALAFFFKYGATDRDINIVGRHDIRFQYELIRHTNLHFRYSLSQSAEYIFDAHPFINPWRFETCLNIFPQEWITSFFVSFIHGHDDYNYRIVDSGNQYSLGVRWDLFQLKEYREED